MTGTVGNGTYKGLAQPLLGEYEQVQENIGVVMATLTGKSGQTADFIQFRNSAGTVVFKVGSDGSGAVQDNGTAAPTTAALTSNGMIMTAWVSSTARIYFRTNNTVYSVAGA